jgi:hypothetical protein
MSTGWKLQRIGTVLVLSSGLLFAGIASASGATSGPSQRKAVKKKKQAELPPLPSGPTGQPLRPMPLDAIAAVPPQVTYENNQLTINAPNSTLADILRAIRKLTGAEIEVPSAPERVVTHLGPGPVRDVIAELLNGSRFNYVLLGSPTDTNALTRVVLVAKSGPQDIAPNPAPTPNANFAQQNMPQEQPADAAADGNETDPAEDNANTGEEAPEEPQPDAEQQQTAPDQQQPGVKTPQQMLQEMQQRQMQMQQQGQPPVPNQGPGSGTQPHPPEQN